MHFFLSKKNPSRSRSPVSRSGGGGAGYSTSSSSSYYKTNTSNRDSGRPSRSRTSRDYTPERSYSSRKEYNRDRLENV